MTFINLHNHDEFSTLDGFGSAKAYAERAKFLNQPALASTNHGNIDGLLKHQKACIAAGIKPILGCELYVVPNPTIKQKGERRGHMVVLVRNAAGWQGLCALLSRANLEGFYSRPRVGFDWFLELSNEQLDGMIFMTACLASFVRLPGGEDLLYDLEHMADVFLEVMPWPGKEQAEWNQECLRLSEKLHIPLIVTNDTHYVLPEDAKAQEVLLAIQRKVKWNDPARFRFEHEGLHLRSEREMIRAFHKHGSLPENVYRAAIERTVDVADLCNFTIPKMQMNLPGSNIDQEAQIGDMISAGLLKRFTGGKGLSQEYSDRIAEEMNIIREKKFNPYFIIVSEFCDWCRKSGITVGPGRGSAGGSLMCYLMGITDVDPIKYGLLFSRFISPDRNDYPDIDLDIDAARISECRKYLEDKYGRDNVAGISTFTRMKARGVIRDVARVFDVPLKEVDEFAKSIPQEKSDGLIKIASESNSGRAFATKYPDVVDMAQKLEGQVKNSGQHPAAIVISADSLLDSGRCVVQEKECVRVINWDMEDSEHVGLMKLDALKLETLTIINECLLRISDGDEAGRLDLNALEMDDKEVFANLSRGEVAGVFQLSGYACKKICLEMGIDKFDDIPAIISLARPGPMQSGMTPDYIKRKREGNWGATLCPEYDAIVDETYGVIVYQEQVMRVFTDVAGMSAGLADKIRKVIGKKRDASEFEPYRIQFIEGCLKQKTFDQNEAEHFWHGLLEWAGYGFNLSHAVEYGIISYQTAWLKHNYPMEYLASFLTYGSEDQKKDVLCEISKKIKITLVTPKIKYSLSNKWAVNGEYLYMPFSAIKGIGEKDAEKCRMAKPVQASKGALAGFFNIPKVEEKKGGTKLQQILEEIKAFDDDVNSAPADFNQYFGVDYAVNTVCVKKQNDIPPKRRNVSRQQSVTRSMDDQAINLMGQTIEPPQRTVMIPKRRM